MKRLFGLGAAVCLVAALGCSDSSERTLGFRDQKITGDVESAVRTSVPGQIEVNTHDGVVTLSGTVPDNNARERAGALASKVSGVARVENNLRATIAADAPRAPANIPPHAPANIPPAPANVPPGAPAPNQPGVPPNLPPAPELR